MTDKARIRIEVAMVALLFGAGGGWAAFQLRLSTVESRLERIEQRVTAIYCQSVPEAQRPACR